ncbi:hypothetical protein HGRIS_014321 [Hohenbuehelia grisea]|uniref:Major facilitator superfamily (MFS) profile domain-containing protein n=1 Tax=Hohenbuehelia grisea TaxID=104357 RepID=A0ABR3JT52_9AGAR
MQSASTSTFASDSPTSLQGKDISQALDIVLVEKHNEQPQEELSPLRKHVILLVLCIAQLLDVFGANAVIVSLPAISRDIGFSAGSIQWMLTAYTLTLASSMLISGTISDIFHAKPVFCAGILIVGLFSIPVATSVHPVMSIVFRALQGLGGAMNIPSAISIIRSTFPDPVSQGRAIGIYTTASTVGNVTGFVVGGFIGAATSWRWKSSSHPCTGWKSPRVITTLALSVVMCVAFFFIEKVVKDPAIAPRTWSNKNLLPLFFISLSPGWWVFTSELQLIAIFLKLWQESAVKAAIRCLPIGITGLCAYFVGAMVTKVHHSIFLIGGQVLMAVAAVLFALMDSVQKYWSHGVPGMIIGMIGLCCARVACTTMMLNSARKEEQGVVAALAWTASQIGVTIGLAITSSITISVNAGRPPDESSQRHGYEASFWSLVALAGVMMVASLWVRK